ncbi:MAG: DUF1559 domain-containing protein, partial [Planctomycetaceae bacterium]|nr:DUF1559 domain-containing protein [Planctomycetaceae bacterium]
MKQGLPPFRCPSDTGPVLNDQKLIGGQSLATSNYVGSNSSDFPHAHNGRPDNSCYAADGIFFRNSSVRIRDITDGTSNTIGVGERAWRVNNTDYFAGVIFGMQGNVPASCSPAVNWDYAGVLGATVRGINTNDTSYSRATYSSQHTGGAQFLLCDGSVRFLSENLEFNSGNVVDTTMERLAGKADGGVIGDF